MHSIMYTLNRAIGHSMSLTLDGIAAKGISLSNNKHTNIHYFASAAVAEVVTCSLFTGPVREVSKYMLPFYWLLANNLICSNRKLFYFVSFTFTNRLINFRNSWAQHFRRVCSFQLYFSVSIPRTSDTKSNIHVHTPTLSRQMKSIWFENKRQPI